MKKLIQTTLMTVALATTTLLASGNHSHDANGGHGYQSPVNKTIAKEKAIKVINTFIEKKIIDKSWSTVDMNSAKRTLIQGNEEWVITFINNKIEDKKKQKLYIFLTLSGRYIAANYTGN